MSDRQEKFQVPGTDVFITRLPALRPEQEREMALRVRCLGEEALESLGLGTAADRNTFYPGNDAAEELRILG